MNNEERFIDQYVEGYKSSIDERPIESCPYSQSDFGKRCSWLAGFSDRKTDLRNAIARGNTNE
jgi:ribosome modulation factor